MPPYRAPVWKPLLAGTGTHGPTFLMHLAPDKSGHVPKSALRDRVPGVRVDRARSMVGSARWLREFDPPTGPALIDRSL